MHDPPEHDAVVPRIESAALAVVLRAAQWALDDLAHDLPEAAPHRPASPSWRPHWSSWSLSSEANRRWTRVMDLD